MSTIFNKYQTEFNLENVEAIFKESLPTSNVKYEKNDIKWVYDNILDDINSIIFLSNLTSLNRPTVESAKKDENGRVIVDLSNPHILENMDYFRPVAVHFAKTGKTCPYMKSRHPMSKYVKFWKEQIKLCMEGLTREDGEWIPGELYWYWNFVPIFQAVKKNSKSRKANRVQHMPKVYDGDYLWFHYKNTAQIQGLHGSCLKARGKGFSFKEGGDVAKNFILGNNIDIIRAKTPSKSYCVAESKQFLTEDGILSKFMETWDWNNHHSNFPRIAGIKDSPSDMHWIMGYKGKDKLLHGSKNEVMGIILNGKPDNVRGKRGVSYKFEEVGSMKSFTTAWQVHLPAVQDGDATSGFSVAFGTGGSHINDFYGLYTAFYNPTALSIYGIPNVYDRKADGTKLCGFFFPTYLNRHSCFDENGNSDLIKSLTQIYTNRWVKKQSNDPNILIQAKAEDPISPAEAVMRKEGSVFPVGDLRTYLENEIESNISKFVSPHYVVELELDSADNVTWKYSDRQPIREFPLSTSSATNSNTKNIDIEGCVELFVLPQYSGNNKIEWGRYIGGIDPYDSDSGSSLGSIFIFDTYKDRIVAEYTGRPSTANGFYEICRRLLKLYNAEGCYENNLKGLFTYFNNTNSLKYLCDTPQNMRDMEFTKVTPIGNQSKGVRATAEVNKFARKQLADYMIKTCETVRINPTTLEEEEITILNLYTIRSIGLIKEAIMYNEDINADRISAMGMVMIYRDNIKKRTESRDYNPTNSIYNDPFFTNDYKIHNNSSSIDISNDFKNIT